MANPAKAQLAPGRSAAAIIAGVIGNVLFSAAWAALVVSLIGLVAKNLLVALIRNALSNASLDSGAGGVLRSVLASIESAIGVISVALVVLAVGGVLFSFFISWLIMKIGGVRKPAAVTLMSFLIAILVNSALFFVYLMVGNLIARNVDSSSPYLIVWFVGTAVVGALIWLWMAWAFRGPATEPAVVPPPAAAGAVQPADGQPVLAAGNEPAAVAPVPDPGAAPSAAAGTPSTGGAVPAAVPLAAAAIPPAGEPDPGKPAGAAAAKAATTKPATTKSATAKSAATKPATAKSAATKPAATKPSASKPAGTKPAAKKPATSKPATKKPAATEPAEPPSDGEQA